jgi:uncharacterized protein
MVNSSNLFESLDSEAYLGTGWSFPIRVNVQGSLQMSSAAQNVEESIWIILRTSVGERASRLEFGSTLSDLTFAPMNSDTLVLLCAAVEDALVQWEPRIELDEVRADPDPIRGRVDLIIDYHLIDGYETRSVVYPFYLQPEELDAIAAVRQQERGELGEKSLESW